jgi:hypothetical protein
MQLSNGTPWIITLSSKGVNSNIQNQATLHTIGNCTMPAWRLQTGTALSDNCDAQNSNIGCGTRFPSTTSYGADFNNVGGGWYVMRKARDLGVSVWFWGRNDPLVPLGIRDGYQYLATTQWRPPDADFPMHSDNCDYDQHFDAHQIIFDLTFCVSRQFERSNLIFLTLSSFIGGLGW